uniref:Uncharacterized protein n=1 Tax=Eptatretus burgeri TaxID=7764 RepID=A0A8C4QIW7_EPTBU
MKNVYFTEIPIGTSGRCLCLDKIILTPERWDQILNCSFCFFRMTLKSDLTKQICLNPQAKWVKRVCFWIIIIIILNKR